MDAPLLALTRRRFRPGDGEPSLTAATENMRQLIQLRWLAVIGQSLTILVARFGLGVPLPLWPMLGIVGAAALVNLVSMPLLKRHRIRRPELLLALLFDVGSLTMQLYLSGGATNPFVSLFLLQVVLGAIILEHWASWVIVGVTSFNYALLATGHLPLQLPIRLQPFAAGLFILGDWICFALVAALLVMFVTRIVRNLRVRDSRLADLQRQTSEEDHLVRMGLFASGAAHELGTPLSTLSVILGDWQRDPKLGRNRALAREIAEMQAEVQRCKTIVTEVLHSVGELPGSRPEPITAVRFVDTIATDWRALHPATLLVSAHRLPPDLAIAADPALRQAVWNLLDNAAEAGSERVELTAGLEDEMLVLSVRDHGPGFPPEMLADLGQARQSSKGAGHGVGLFLVTSVVRKLQGRVDAANRATGGAEVSINLPIASIALRGS